MRSIAHQNYLKQKIESATPIGRIVIMCEACIKFLNQAKESLKRGDKITFTDKTIKAQNIIREFRNSLNMDVDPKIAGGFYVLYNYMLKSLMKSLRTKTYEGIDEVIGMVARLNEAWKEADKKGLAKDVKRYEERKPDETGSFKRIAGKQGDFSSYNTAMRSSLNLVS